MPKLPLTGQVYKRLSLVLGAGLLLSLGANAWLISRKTPSQGGNLPETLASAVVKPVQAEEIYPLFVCPCCGKSIDQCTCPMAKERKSYIDVLIETNDSIAEETLIAAYIKKYGLDSFLDENRTEAFRNQLIAAAPAERPIISLTPSSYNFGDISQLEGVISTIFTIQNTGQTDLTIDRLETSCGCTSASVIYQGEEGPQFGMPGHGTDEPPENWQVTIPAGEAAELKVYYDPSTHPDFRGPATRAVSIFSNDPIDLEKKVTIELNQID